MNKSIFFGLISTAASILAPAVGNAYDCAPVNVDDAGVILGPPAWSEEDRACVITGHMAEYDGQDGNPYAIQFEIRLPKDWNGNYVHQFNGGVDGIVAPARGAYNIGRPEQSALALGYAVVSSNAGHAIDAHPDQGLQGATQFGFDARARANYGYAAVASLDPVARKVVETAYDAPIRYAYGIGRSNGGRHAMVAASRMPDAFDGFLVGYPGFNLPKASIQHAWDTQAFHGLTGDVRTAFSRADLDIVSTAILDQCDALDGLADGMVFDYQACQGVFNPDKLVCDGEGCLSAEQVAVLKRITTGPETLSGAPLYSDWYWDAGINSNNWRQWKLESSDEKIDRMPRIVAMGGASLAQVFSTPPTPLGHTPTDMLNYLLSYDFETDPAKIGTTTADFPESGLDVMLPPEMDFAEFHQAGGKMIVFHGQSDPVFSAKDTVDWFRDAPQADGYAKLYLVPNMPHGHSEAAPDDFDLFAALVGWVEHGVAPADVTARTAPKSGPSVSRPLCPYPLTATYIAGDPAKAESFVCRNKGN